jgi:hypothetical protein
MMAEVVGRRSAADDGECGGEPSERRFVDARADSKPADRLAAIDDDRPASAVECDQGASAIPERTLAGVGAGRDATVRRGAEGALVQLETRATGPL